MKFIKKTVLQLFIFSIFSLIFIFSSCRKDEDFIEDSSAKLGFSTDSLMFDTVFTTMGSVTKQIRIYNPNDKSIRIKSIRLANGVNSMFRINVDGVPDYQFANVEIAAKDSMYIFVKVTVNPNNQNNPLVVSDSIVFETNGNIQDVKLIAWGQDAYYHVPNKKLTFNDGSYITYSFAGCKVPWATDKPHVIFGLCVIDSDSTLIIPEGAKIHMAPDAILWVLDNASLKINGSINNKVKIQGCRSDEHYRNLPGQWGKIWLSRASINNEIKHAIIRNGGIGIQIDTNVNANPTLKLENTLIENMSVAGIFAQGAKLNVSNSVITNCGQYAVVLSIGGYYEFYHTTIGNYWNYNYRQTPSLVLNNYYKYTENGIDKISLRPLVKALFANCIVYGNNEKEIVLDKNSNAVFNFEFDHCLLKTELNTSNVTNYKSCIINQNPLFKNTDVNDLHLMQNSPAKESGNTAFGMLFPVDLDGVIRSGNPSIGAYEFVITSK